MNSTSTISDRHGPCFEILFETIISNHDTFRCEMDHNVAEFNKESHNFIPHQTVFASGTEPYTFHTLALLRSDSSSSECILKEVKSDSLSYFPIQYTWERHIGLTRMIYENHDTLQLVDHHVTQ